MSIKLLHTSDLHIDWLFSRFSPSARKVRRRELLASLENIVQIAVKERVDGVLICGDLFHSNRVDKHIVTEVWLTLEKATAKGIQIFVLPGNHDYDLENIFVGLEDSNPNIHIFNEHRNYSDAITGLHIYGLPYNVKKSTESPLQSFAKVQAPGIHVAMLHGTLKTLPFVEERYCPIEPEELVRSGFDYVALGHYHNYKDCSTGGVTIVYSGSPNVLSFGASDERYVGLVELSKDRTEVTPLKIPSRPYQLHQLNVTGMTTLDVYRQFENWVDPEACVRVSLTGIVDDEELFPLQAPLLEMYADKFFHLEIDDNTLLIPKDSPNDQTIKGIFIRKINEQLNSTVLSEQERVIVLESLRVGLRAIEGRKLS